MPRRFLDYHGHNPHRPRKRLWIFLDQLRDWFHPFATTTRRRRPKNIDDVDFLDVSRLNTFIGLIFLFVALLGLIGFLALAFDEPRPGYSPAEDTDAGACACCLVIFIPLCLGIFFIKHGK